MKTLEIDNPCLFLSIEDLPGEEWREISEFGGRYEVSNYSRIKEVDKERIIKKHIIKGIYLVRLKTTRKLKWYTPYRLCAIAFLNNEENMPDVLHKDNEKTNDRVENLYWGKRKIIRNPRFGENHGRAVLNQTQVNEIREKFQKGYSLKELQFDYGVSVGCIQGVIENKNWKTKEGEDI